MSDKVEPDLPPELIAKALEFAKKMPGAKYVADELVKYGVPRPQAQAAAQYIYRIKQRQTRVQGMIYLGVGLILLVGCGALTWLLWNNASLRVRLWWYALAGLFMGGVLTLGGLWKLLAG